MTRRQFPKSVLSGLAFLDRPRSHSVAISPLPLFNCKVAGLQYYEGLRIIDTLQPDQRLNLVREPKNTHDPSAIAVFTPDNRKIGYLPRYLNKIPATHLDNGKKLYAVVYYADPGALPWEMLEVTVTMS